MTFSFHTLIQKLNASQSLFSLLMAFSALILGAVVGLVAGWFELSFKTLSKLWQSLLPTLLNQPAWLIFALMPFVVLPILYVILRFIPEKRPHNPADLIAAIHIDNGKMNVKSSLLTVLGAVVSLTGGFSVGYYAPTLQLGASLGALLNKIKSIPPQLIYIHVGAGAAAAIAAIFHSPIAAVVFVHEVLLRFFSVRAFAAITLSAISGYLVSSRFFHKAIFFTVPSHYVNDLKTYLFAALFAILAASLGAFLVKSIMFMQSWTNKRQWGLGANLVFSAIITAFIVSRFPFVAGSESQMMQNILSAKPMSIGFLALILLMKWLATVSSLGLRVAGGIFGPTIFLGATLGSLCTQMATMLIPDLALSHEVLIITTMAAMITSVIGAPISMILIVIEITGNFHLISIVMLSVVVANLTAYCLINSSSFFDILLKTRGMDFEGGRERVYAEHKGIVALISDDYLAFSPQTKAQICEEKMLSQKQELAFIVDDNQQLIGQVRLVEVERLCQQKSEVDIRAVIETPMIVLYRNTSIWQAMKQMYTANNRQLAVIDGENNPTLLGVVYPKMLMESYFNYLEVLRHSENVRR